MKVTEFFIGQELKRPTLLDREWNMIGIIDTEDIEKIPSVLIVKRIEIDYRWPAYFDGGALFFENGEYALPIQLEFSSFNTYSWDETRT